MRVYSGKDTICSALKKKKRKLIKFQWTVWLCIYVCLQAFCANDHVGWVLVRLWKISRSERADTAGAGCGRRLLSPVVYACAHVGPVHSLCDSSDLYTELIWKLNQETEGFDNFVVAMVTFLLSCLYWTLTNKIMVNRKWDSGVACVYWMTNTG